LREISQSSERSSLFWWMVEHHRELKDGAAGNRFQWEPLSIIFNELGLTDINGNPPKPGTARQTWLRVRRYVAEAERLLAADPRRQVVHPSHMSKNFRPAGVQFGQDLPEQRVPARPLPTVEPDQRVSRQDEGSPPSAEHPLPAEGTLNKAFSQLDNHDFYLHLGKPNRSKK
jgi:hypothetical protein